MALRTQSTNFEGGISSPLSPGKRIFSPVSASISSASQITVSRYSSPKICNLEGIAITSPKESLEM